MARRRTNGTGRQVNQYNRYVRGSAAYDYDYLEQERERRAERERRERRERLEWERREAARRKQQQRRAAQERPVHKARERQRISPLTLLGFAAAAALVMVMLAQYAQLTAISNSVVTMKKELSALQEENVALLGRYESTFDLAAVKEAAEANGMAKPSASQVYYVDLSTPNNVVIYKSEEADVLGRFAASVKRDISFLLEYFR